MSIASGYYSVPGKPGHGLHLVISPAGTGFGMWYGHDFTGSPTWLALTIKPEAGGSFRCEALASPGSSGDPIGPMKKSLQVAGHLTISRAESPDQIKVTYWLSREAVGAPELEFSPPPPDSALFDETMTRLA